MLPLLPIALGLGAAKLGVDIYSGIRQGRANERLQHRQEDNEKTQEHDQRRAAIMRNLGVNAPMVQHQLKSLGHGTDLSAENTSAGLLGLGSQLASLYAAQAGNPATSQPTDVPMPYQQQAYPSAYGPGSLIKPGTPYRY